MPGHRIGLIAPTLNFDMTAEAFKAEQEFLEQNAANDKTATLVTAVKQLLCGPGELGQMKGKTFFNFVSTLHAQAKAERKLEKGNTARGLADLNAGMLARKIERRRVTSKTVEQRVHLASQALASTGVSDDEAGDKQLLEKGLAMLLSKKRPTGAGDIALYLKKLFNEEKDPDDDDIACLAGLISAAIDDSDDEDDDTPVEPEPEPESGVDASEIAVLKSEIERLKRQVKLSYDDGYDEAYADAYEEGYAEAAAAADGPVGPVVVAELAAKSLAQKKEQVLHAIASPVPAAASVV
jgi:hypothetical protein